MARKSKRDSAGTSSLDALNDDSFVKILSAAKKLFLRNGYAATTLRDVAAEAGVTLGLIPYYFKNKEVLASKVVYSILGDFRQTRLAQWDMSGLTEAERTYVLNLLLYEYEFSDPYFGSLFFEISALTDISYEFYDAFRASVYQIIHELGLSVTEHHLQMCLVSLAGMERGFAKTHLKQTLAFNYVEFWDMIYCGFLFNLGVPEQTIRTTRENAHAFYFRLKKEANRQLRTAD